MKSPIKSPLPLRENGNPGMAAATKFKAEWKAGRFVYGGVVSKEWIEDAMGMQEDGVTTPSDMTTFRGQWMRAMAIFRSLVLNDLQVLIVTTGDPAGYYIVRPEEQTAYAVHEFTKEVSRAAKRSSEIADNTNLDVLTSEQKREAADHRALLRRMQEAVGGAMLQAAHVATSIPHVPKDEG